MINNEFFLLWFLSILSLRQDKVHTSVICAFLFSNYNICSFWGNWFVKDHIYIEQAICILYETYLSQLLVSQGTVKHLYSCDLIFARPTSCIYSQEIIFAYCHFFFYSPYIRNYWRGFYFCISMLKEFGRGSMAWQPDRRSNFFFSLPSHLYAFTCLTEISLIVMLSRLYTLTQSSKFLSISIQQFQRRSQNVSANQMQQQPSWFFYEKRKLGRGHWVPASCQISTKVKKSFGQSEARATNLVFRSALETQTWSRALNSCFLSSSVCHIVQRFQRRSLKFLSQSDDKVAFLIFRSVRKTQIW